RKKKQDGLIEFNFVTSYLILLILTAVANFFFIYLLFFDPNTYHLMPIVIIWKLATFFEYLSYLPVFIAIEWRVLNLKLKGIPSSVLVFIAFLILFYPIDSKDDIEFLSSFVIVAVIAGLFIFVVFLYLGIKIPGLRRPAFLYIFGAIINTIGQQLGAENVLIFLSEEYGQTAYTSMQIFSLTLRAIGLLMAVIGISQFEYVKIKDREKVIKDLITYKEIEYEGIKPSLIEALEASKPDIITRGEISHFREKEICLVCRSKVSGSDIFLCPNCDTLYCKNCAIALSIAENLCWVCNRAIDETKPIIHFEKPKEKKSVKKPGKKPKKS
ncbi:MAG: hypothetical protein ACFFCM_19145, partial [Promethearchaeota archaeon]